MIRHVCVAALFLVCLLQVVESFPGLKETPVRSLEDVKDVHARVERGTGRGRSGKDPRRNHGSNGRKGHYRPKEAKRERAHHERMNGKQRDEPETNPRDEVHNKHRRLGNRAEKDQRGDDNKGKQRQSNEMEAKDWRSGDRESNHRNIYEKGPDNSQEHGRGENHEQDHGQKWHHGQGHRNRGNHGQGLGGHQDRDHGMKWPHGQGHEKGAHYRNSSEDDDARWHGNEDDGAGMDSRKQDETHLQMDDNKEEDSLNTDTGLLESDDSDISQLESEESGHSIWGSLWDCLWGKDASNDNTMRGSANKGNIWRSDDRADQILGSDDRQTEDSVWNGLGKTVTHGGHGHRGGMFFWKIWYWLLSHWGGGGLTLPRPDGGPFNKNGIFCDKNGNPITDGKSFTGDTDDNVDSGESDDAERERTDSIGETDPDNTGDYDSNTDDDDSNTDDSDSNTDDSDNSDSNTGGYDNPGSVAPVGVDPGPGSDHLL